MCWQARKRGGADPPGSSCDFHIEWLQFLSFWCISTTQALMGFVHRMSSGIKGSILSIRSQTSKASNLSLSAFASHKKGRRVYTDTYNSFSVLFLGQYSEAAAGAKMGYTARFPEWGDFCHCPGLSSRHWGRMWQNQHLI